MKAVVALGGDGILFGAAGSPASSAVVAYLRWERDAYAGVRPIKYYPGAASPLKKPDGIDIARVMPDLRQPDGLSAVMMLEHMGLAAEAGPLEVAVARGYRDATRLTRDQGGTATTKELARAVLDALR